MTDRDKCLKAICEADAAICNHPYTFPCTYIARVAELPVKKVRKIMQQLEASGYVIRNHEGGYDDWSGHIYCIHGYSVTKKAQQTGFWKDFDRKEQEYWNKTGKSMLEVQNEDIPRDERPAV